MSSTIDVRHDPPFGADRLGHLTARGADGLDSVDIRLRFAGERGTRGVIALLAKVCIEVLVRSREITPVLPPEHEGGAAVNPMDRVAESRRWRDG